MEFKLYLAFKFSLLKVRLIPSHDYLSWSSNVAFMVKGDVFVRIKIGGIKKSSNVTFISRIYLVSPSLRCFVYLFSAIWIISSQGYIIIEIKYIFIITGILLSK